MAEILIKNMEMPKECITGNNFNYEYCPLFGKCHGKKPKDEGCLLVEVPPHGDLKDADSIRKKMVDKYERRKRTWDPFYAEGFLYAIDMLDKAPIILEATK